MYSTLQMQSDHFADMEQEYKSTKDELRLVKNQLQELDAKLENQKEQTKIIPEDHLPETQIVQTKYVDRVVYKTDTIYSVQQIVQEVSPERIVDTLYIKEIITPSNLNEEKLVEEASIKEENKKPKKVEFILSKQPMEKTKSLDVKLQINGSTVVRKNN